MVEADPSVYAPGENADNVDQYRVYAGCPGAGGPCNYASVGLISNEANSTYHSLQVALSRHFSNGLGFLASYWFSKSLDDVSSFNLSGSAQRSSPARTTWRRIRSTSPPNMAFALRRPQPLVDQRQLSPAPVEASAPRGRAGAEWVAVERHWHFLFRTPFTVYDSANVSLQGSAPEITASIRAGRI